MAQTRRQASSLGVVNAWKYHMNDLIELIGAKTGNCFRAAIALEEIKAEYTVQKIRLHRGEHKTKSYLELNPAGLVPTLIDRNFDEVPLILTQSNAIIFHAAEMRPGVLFSTSNARERARTIERFFFFVTDVVVPNNTAFVLQRIGDEAGAIALYQRSISTLAVAEPFLAEHAYMAGESFTIADIPAITIISSMKADIDWDTLPRLKDWFDRVSVRPSVLAGMRAFD